MLPEQDYKKHWDEKFRKGNWGRYPTEDVVRYIARNYAGADRSQVSALEIGCGPGANLWFLHREGFRVAGIDGSSSAIEQAGLRLAQENKKLNTSPPDLIVGDFSSLPWDDGSFDLVMDIVALYANTLDVIAKTLDEIHRVLKPGGRFYSKVWGRNCTGYDSGIEIEPGTYEQISAGAFADMGVAHFFDKDEIKALYSMFDLVAIDTVSRHDDLRGYSVEEYHCQFLKAKA